jgi:hypothetical protein
MLRQAQHERVSFACEHLPARPEPVEGGAHLWIAVEWRPYQMIRPTGILREPYTSINASFCAPELDGNKENSL